MQVVAFFFFFFFPLPYHCAMTPKPGKKESQALFFCLEGSVKVLDPAGHVRVGHAAGTCLSLRDFGDLSACWGSKQ